MSREVEDIIAPDQMTDAEMAAFMEKGEMPTRKPEPVTGEEEETSSGEAEESETDEGPESGAASDAAEKDKQDKGQKPWKDTRDGRRITRLTEEKRKLEERIAALERGQSTSTQTQQTKPDGKSERKPAPKLKDFDTWEKYEEARDAYDAEQRKLDLAEIIAKERETSAKAERETAEKEQSEKAAKDFAKRALDYRKTLKEDNFVDQFNEVVEMVRDYPHLSEAIRDSEVGPQLVAYFAENPDEFDTIAAKNERQSLIALGKLEASGKFSGPAKPKKITSVRGGTMDVGGKGGGSDLQAEIEAAFAAGDHAKAARLMDKMEEQESKTRRR